LGKEKEYRYSLGKPFEVEMEKIAALRSITCHPLLSILGLNAKKRKKKGCCK
jgi:hypothetical protein